MKENEPLLKEEKERLFISDDVSSKIDLPKIEAEEETPVSIESKAEEKPVITEEKDDPAIEHPVIEDENVKITVEPPKKENNDKEKSKKALIITIILGVIVLYILVKGVYAYYLGFKYKDYDPNKEQEIVDKAPEDNNSPQEISLESIVLQNNYQKYQMNLCSNNGSLLEKLYVDNKVVLDTLSINEVAIMIFNKVDNLTCGTPALSVDVERIRNLSLELFATDSYLNELMANETAIYGNFSVTYDATSSTFNIQAVNCDFCPNNDFSIHKLEKAETENDYLYIYERFGLFKTNQAAENTFNVYADGLGTKTLGTYVKETTETEFTEYSNLSLYKWTLKKGTENNYYFVSLEKTN